MKNFITNLYQRAAHLDRAAVAVARTGLIIVLLWIGGLKICRYEAEGILPFVSNSPFMSFLLADPAGYKTHENPPGSVVDTNLAWNRQNHTYTFAYALGSVIVLLGLMLCTHPWLPQIAALGSFLVFLMSWVTLSFLITTPECWVPNLGDPVHGFPLLNLPGLLVVKDVIMMGAALVTLADSAKSYLRKKGFNPMGPATA